MRIAIVGTGIAGNVAAYHLSRDHEVTVFEADDRIGGHTNTVDVELAGRNYAIDTGFIVFNDRTYPNFIELLDELGVEYLYLQFVSITGRIMGKGIPGFALPGLVALVYLVGCRRFPMLFDGTFRIARGALVLLTISLPWFVAITVLTTIGERGYLDELSREIRDEIWTRFRTALAPAKWLMGPCPPPCRCSRTCDKGMASNDRGALHRGLHRHQRGHHLLGIVPETAQPRTADRTGLDRGRGRQQCRRHQREHNAGQ